MIALALTTVAAITDIRTGKIPNWLTLGALLCALVENVTHGNIGSALAGAVLCGLFPVYLFARRLPLCGGGDVKLLVAIGAVCHATQGLAIEAISFLFGWILLNYYKPRLRFAPIVLLATILVEVTVC